MYTYYWNKLFIVYVLRLQEVLSEIWLNAWKFTVSELCIRILIKIFTEI